MAHHIKNLVVNPGWIDKMINPEKISNFNLSDDELEMNLLFWICAAGKNGRIAAKCLSKFQEKLDVYTDSYGSSSMFVKIRKFPYDREFLSILMKQSGIGCSKMKGRAFWDLAHARLNLRTCSLDDLTNIYGIGLKTACGFLTHTRPGQRYAVIDTHILKFLGHQGIIVPKATPSNPKKYQELEKAFLDICDQYNLSVADLDLAVWNHYSSRRDKTPFDLGAYVYGQQENSFSNNGRG